MMVKFPKTFIYENTKNYKTKEIKIASENKKSAIIWKFINYENDKNFIEGIFSINNKEGEIKKNKIYISLLNLHLFQKKKNV